jgi:hypothetical protein
MIDLVWLILIAWFSVGLGRSALRTLRLAPPDLARQWTYGAAFGLGLLGFGTFALVTLHLATFGGAVALLIGCALISFRMLIRSAREAWIALRSLRGQTVNRWIGLAAAIFGLHIIVNLISSFNPPIDVDTLAYHLSLPKIFIAHNGFVTRPDIVYSNWPLHTEMMYLLAMLLHGDLLAQLISFLIGLIAVGAIWAGARLHIGARLAALAALIFYTIPVVGYETSITYVDLTVGLYGLLAWFAFVEWWDTNESRWLWLSALTSGFAPAVKLSGAFIPALLMIGVLLRSNSWRARLRSVIGYGLIAGSILLPWLIKTFSQTGNPIAPYLFNLLGALDWTARAAQRATGLFAPFGLGHDLLSFALLPWNMTMYSSSFGGGNIGPIFLAALPALIFARPIPKLIKHALIFSPGYAVIWFLQVQEVRFFIAALPMLSLAAAYALNQWARSGRAARYAAITLIAVTGLANLVLLATNFARPPGSVPPTKGIAVSLGREARADYLHRIDPTYAIIESANRLPADAKLLLIGMGECYYLDREFVRGYPIEQPLFDLAYLPTAAALAQRARELGITHFIINRNVRDDGSPRALIPDDPPDYLDRLNAFVQQDLTLLDQANGYELYSWQH